MDDTLPTALRVTAQIRLAAASGVPVLVVHKGDPDSGSILLKINRLDGSARLLMQVRNEKGLAWMSVHDTDAIPDKEADAYLFEQIDFDPDLWVLEVEDREGRHWFPEPVLTAS
jgi:hypothetical protein